MSQKEVNQINRVAREAVHSAHLDLIEDELKLARAEARELGLDAGVIDRALLVLRGKGRVSDRIKPGATEKEELAEAALMRLREIERVTPEGGTAMGLVRDTIKLLELNA